MYLWEKVSSGLSYPNFFDRNPKTLRDLYQDPDLRVLNPYAIVQDGVTWELAELTIFHGHTESTATYEATPSVRNPESS